MLAHTGHALTGIWSGIIHPLTGVDHLLAMVAVGLLAVVVADRRVAWATPAAFVGGMIVGGGLGIAGVGVSFVDPMIAVSVVVLGGLLAVSVVRRSVISARWMPAVALGFGALHGLAHGAEIPAGVTPVTYVAGFVAATVALHLAGVAVGSTVWRPDPRPAQVSSGAVT